MKAPSPAYANEPLDTTRATPGKLSVASLRSGRKPL
jgi:hypothetical protein